MKSKLFNLLNLLALLLVSSMAMADDAELGTLTDFDGNIYQTIKIGDQVWMAENLRTTRYADGRVLESFVLDDNETNAEKYGRLYRRKVALQSPSGSDNNSSVIQGISPEGWHIPSEEEWIELINYLGGESVAGGKLKGRGPGTWQDPNTDAADDSKFGALPTGWFDFSGQFEGVGEKTFLMSATSPGGRGGYARELNSKSASFKQVFLHPDDAISIRCIKDD